MLNMLRMGICGCTDSYHGEFSDKTFIIDCFNEKKVLPLMFQIKEILVPEKDQHATFISSRCHFFLDKHYWHFLKNPLYHINLFCYDYVLHTKTGIEIPFCGWGLAQGWTIKEPPQTQEMMDTIRGILTKFDEDDIYGWLMHLTPCIDPRMEDNRQEPFKIFQARAFARRARRLEEYHCYPVCIDH